MVGIWWFPGPDAPRLLVVARDVSDRCPEGAELSVKVLKR